MEGYRIASAIERVFMDSSASVVEYHIMVPIFPCGRRCWNLHHRARCNSLVPLKRYHEREIPHSLNSSHENFPDAAGRGLQWLAFRYEYFSGPCPLDVDCLDVGDQRRFLSGSGQYLNCRP